MLAPSMPHTRPGRLGVRLRRRRAGGLGLGTRPHGADGPRAAHALGDGLQDVDLDHDLGDFGLVRGIPSLGEPWASETRDMELDLLAQMHLLLREYGWEPDHESTEYIDGGVYYWTHPDCEVEITTARDGVPALWAEWTGEVRDLYYLNRETDADGTNFSDSVDGLRTRLQELAKK